MTHELLLAYGMYKKMEVFVRTRSRPHLVFLAHDFMRQITERGSVS